MRSRVRKGCTALKGDCNKLYFLVLVHLFFLTIFILTLLLYPSTSTASESLSLSEDQTHQVLADKARQKSAARARAALGYHHFYFDPNEVPKAIDYGAISNQLQRLPVTPPLPQYPQAVPYGLPHPGWHQLHQLYGAPGITITSVSYLMEQRLRMGQFGPLRLGGVEDNGMAITVRLVTHQGKTARVMSVDKQTGLWTTVQ